MTDQQAALLMLGMFIFIILLGFPIAFTLMAMGVAFGYYAYFQPDQAFFDNRVFYLFTQNTFSVMNNDTLVAVPDGGTIFVAAPKSGGPALLFAFTAKTR